MDFIACHEEEIHIPGHIQSFGYLIGLDAETKAIKFYSSNLQDLFKFEGDIFGKKFEDLPETFPQIIDSEIPQKINEYTTKENDLHIFKISVKWDFLHSTMYRLGNTIYLEFEKIIEHFSNKSFISSKYSVFGVAEHSSIIWSRLLESFAEVVDYDRIMVYKFLEDGSGKVVAEKTRNGLESYLNLHYPESDIPRQARALYMVKKNRIFSNVYEEPVPILSKTEEKVDLTYSSVRAMSPIHAQYIKNTGVSSSFSTSIIVDNKLWGLVTCQNEAPKHIDLVNRIRAEVFTQMAANAYHSFKTEQKYQDSIELNNNTGQLKNDFLKSETLRDSLFNNVETLKNLVRCDGFAILTGDEVKTFGDVPLEENLFKIRKWVVENSAENVYADSSFLKNHGEELGLDRQSAGILATKWSTSEHNEMMIWLRNEYNEHVLWAGYETKKTEKVSHYGEEKMMVSPRKSFEIFEEEIKGKSKLWQHRDILAAERILALILETSYNQHVKVKELNEALKNLNVELESFSYTISHDLATPLSIIKLNAQLLGNANPEDFKIKERVLKITREIDGMEEMMRNILQLSRAKNADLKLEKLETEQVIQKIIYDAKLTFNSENAEVTVNNFPEVLADKTMLYQVFSNIINNAVKYSSNHDTPKIDILGVYEGNKVVYIISDNGIGIGEDDHDKMFKIFNRMDNARNFKGNGVGLSIVDRIMNRLGGKVTFESKINEGSRFFLTFQKPSE